MGKRFETLERRVAALEGQAQRRQEEWDNITKAWKTVLIEFCKEFGLPLPEQLTEMES